MTQPLNPWNHKTLGSQVRLFPSALVPDHMEEFLEVTSYISKACHMTRCTLINTYQNKLYKWIYPPHKKNHPFQWLIKVTVVWNKVWKIPYACSRVRLFPIIILLFTIKRLLEFTIKRLARIQFVIYYIMVSLCIITYNILGRISWSNILYFESLSYDKMYTYQYLSKQII